MDVQIMNTDGCFLAFLPLRPHHVPSLSSKDPRGRELPGRAPGVGEAALRIRAVISPDLGQSLGAWVASPAPCQTLGSSALTSVAAEAQLSRARVNYDAHPARTL